MPRYDNGNWTPNSGYYLGRKLLAKKGILMSNTTENKSSLATYWYLCHAYKLKNGLYRYKFGTKQFNFVCIDADSVEMAKKKLFVNLPEGAKFSGV